ncbi:lipoprotein insertase outer membrane protein LolB [Thioalkalivibrio sp. ALM2T]|uniref:lipoprotein insertase outer membrane protein LolB n=1 Tax=Thioalkalivibrio sp. ALM2T TaxID=1158184 RepID=UPI000367AD1F|nr:lipoprotein insertase outer membrane protein LolB [Thioalkalivibrio sp. ALM2T]
MNGHGATRPPRRIRGTGWLAGLVGGWGLLLAGCAAPLPEADTSPAAEAAFEERTEQLAALDSWRLVARLGLASGEEYWSAQLNWRVQEGQHVLDLSGPMGRGGGRLTLSDNGRALLVTRSGERFQAQDPDTLVARVLGESIPVSGMIYWVRGLLHPEASYQLDIDADGRPLEILQSGWAIEYTEFEEVDGVSMPVAMVLEREEVELRARIGRWQLGPDETW